MSEPAILFAPVLRAEKWTSIELQQQNILEAVRIRTPARRISVAEVAGTFSNLPFGKQLLRDIYYPRLIRRQAADLGPCVLHVTDHSYGHLCTAHRPAVVNCNDLHTTCSPTCAVAICGDGNSAWTA